MREAYHLNLKLFGIIDFKDIEVDVSDTKYAIPCGMPPAHAGMAAFDIRIN